MENKSGNETEITPSRHRDASGKWKLTAGIALAVMLILVGIAMPFVQNVLRVNWIRDKGGYVKTLPAEAIRFLPETLQQVLNTGYLGLATGEVTAVLLSGPTVADEDVARLTSCVNPEFLAIESDQLTDDCLRHLRGISNLKGLRIDSVQFTDNGLHHLESLPGLTILSLKDNNVTDAGLKHLDKLRKLKTLSLDNTKVTDAGLVHLAKMPNLEMLTLNKTAVSDAGLNHLKGMTRLKYLELDGTRVTAEGAKSLKDALPKCRIHWLTIAP